MNIKQPYKLTYKQVIDVAAPWMCNCRMKWMTDIEVPT